MNRIQMKIAAAIVVLHGAGAWAAPMGPVARTVIPSDVRQIISIDYRTGRKFDTPMFLKAQVLPDNLKKFEYTLKEIEVNPDTDVASLVFASFDNGKQGLSMVAVASGLTPKTVLTGLRQENVKPVKYRDSDIYAMGKVAMTFLDDNTLLMGDDSALRAALSVRERSTSNVDSNPQIMELVKSVEKATVWSVLDQQTSQNMLLSAIGDAGTLVNLASIKQVLGAHYAMNFRYGIKFNLVVLTSDNATATKVSSLLKAGVLYKKVTANPEQRIALENVTLTSARLATVADPKIGTSDRSYLRIEFKADQQQFERLLRSHCFTEMSSERNELRGLTSGDVTDVSKWSTQRNN